MMISMRAVHSQADAHRHDLVAMAEPRHIGRTNTNTNTSSNSGPAPQRSVAGLPVAGDRAVRRTIAPRFGNWLIEFGTRLGGASVRTS